MPTFSIYVTASLEQAKTHQQAQEFISQSILLGHSIAAIFLYSDAVSVAKKIKDAEVCRSWVELALKHNLEIDLCIGAAEKRGIDNVNKPFKLSGLGELAEILTSDDKLIHFKA